jgi:hypothetical protein
MKYNIVPNEVLVRTSFLGAAKASKGRNLGCSDNRVCFPVNFLFLGLFCYIVHCIGVNVSQIHLWFCFALFFVAIFPNC